MVDIKNLSCPRSSLGDAIRTIGLLAVEDLALRSAGAVFSRGEPALRTDHEEIDVCA
jgi:hypothetical protein